LVVLVAATTATAAARGTGTVDAAYSTVFYKRPVGLATSA
jgi:hypothetical protein